MTRTCPPRPGALPRPNGKMQWSSGPSQMSGMAAALTSQSRWSTARVSGDGSVDRETSLPLVICWRCTDVRLIALTVKNTDNPNNLVRRFFKCPRNQKGVPTSCPVYMFQTDYEEYLQKNGMLDKHLSGVRDESAALKWELEDMKKEFLFMKTRAQNANGLEAMVAQMRSQIKIILFLVCILVVLVLLDVLLHLIK